MKHLAPLALLATAPAFADVPPPSTPQPQPTLTKEAPHLWNLDWQGVDGRTYFIQTSLDLATWDYQPVMAFGEGLWSTQLGSTHHKYFVRLLHVDDPSVTTTEQAGNADFDSDGIPNLFELETVGSDPLDAADAGGDPGGNGMADGWELYYFGAVGTANPNAAPQPDGLTHKEKCELGLSPAVNYASATASQASGYAYDPTGRLTSVTAPVAAASYAPDEEGNLTRVDCSSYPQPRNASYAPDEEGNLTTTQ